MIKKAVKKEDNIKRLWNFGFISLSGALLMFFFTGIGSNAYASTIPNIFTGGTCTDSQHYGSNDCTQAFDGNVNTYWHTSVAGAQWIKYDRGAGNATSSQSIFLIFGDDSTKGNKLFSGGTVEILGSNDDSTWTSLASSTASGTTASMFLTWNNTTAWRYWKIIENNAGFNNSQIDVFSWNVILPIITEIATSSTATSTIPTGSVEAYTMIFWVLSFAVFVGAVSIAIWLF